MVLEEDCREGARCMIYPYCVDRGFFQHLPFVLFQLLLLFFTLLVKV